MRLIYSNMSCSYFFREWSRQLGWLSLSSTPCQFLSSCLTPPGPTDWSLTRREIWAVHCHSTGMSAQSATARWAAIQPIPTSHLHFRPFNRGAIGINTLPLRNFHTSTDLPVLPSCWIVWCALTWLKAALQWGHLTNKACCAAQRFGEQQEDGCCPWPRPSWAREPLAEPRHRSCISCTDHRDQRVVGGLWEDCGRRFYQGPAEAAFAQPLWNSANRLECSKTTRGFGGLWGTPHPLRKWLGRRVVCDAVRMREKTSPI